MRKIMFLFAAAVVLAVVGCSKDDAALNDVQYVSELKINFDGDTRVSASHSAAGLKFAWEDGDVVYVYEDGNTDATRKKFVYDTESASFKPDSDSDRLEVGKNYFAGFKAQSIKMYITDGRTEVSFWLDYYDGIKGIPMITDVFTATEENTMATMHHLVGVVEIPVKAASEGAKLVQLFISSRNNVMSGNFYASPEAPYFIRSSRGYSDIGNQDTSDTPIDLSTTEATSIFVPAFPGTYEAESIYFSGKLVGEKEYVDIETERSLTVERGKITKVSELVLDYIAE